MLLSCQALALAVLFSLVSVSGQRGQWRCWTLGEGGPREQRPLRGEGNQANRISSPLPYLAPGSVPPSLFALHTARATCLTAQSTQGLPAKPPDVITVRPRQVPGAAAFTEVGPGGTLLWPSVPGPVSMASTGNKLGAPYFLPPGALPAPKTQISELS